MKVQEFERKYGDKGGIQKLTELRSLFFGQAYIAKHFGVTKENVRRWMLHFFGSAYDPRPDRKEVIIESMLDFARHNPIDVFKSAYRGTQYYKETLQDCKNLKIYDDK